jgi:uncharacterized membrane protein YbaN (DUF454 family)
VPASINLIWQGATTVHAYPFTCNRVEGLDHICVSPFSFTPFLLNPKEPLHGATGPIEPHFCWKVHMTLTPHRNTKRAFVTLWAWRVLGGTALLLGMVGVVLPLLPTTPFVIVAAFAFAKSAPNLHKKLLQNRTFGPMITQWEQKGAIAPRHKAMAVGMMAAAFGAAVLFGAPVYALSIQLVFMGGAALFVITRPSA